MIKELIKSKIEISLTPRDLMEAGVHFGHKISKWHPKIGSFIYGKKNNIHIIDVAKTLESIRVAGSYIVNTIKEGKSILIVGTKRQAREAVACVAEEVKEHFVNVRWPGGLLTNPSSKQSLAKMIRLQKKLEDPSSDLTKKEQIRIGKQLKKLTDVFGGITKMEETPGLMIVVDIRQEDIAVKEAKTLGIPVIGIVDTNSNPFFVDCPIVANDDSINSISIILNELGQIISQAKDAIYGKEEIAEDEMQAKAEIDE